MKTFLQLLRIGFWMLPMQRVLTVLGGAVVIVSLLFDLPFRNPVTELVFIFAGVGALLATPLFAGGVFFRMLASPRHVLLWPHGKGKLLAGMIGITLLCTTAWILIYFATYLHAPPKFRPDFEHYTMQYVLTFTFWTLCWIGMFVISRGPVWALAVIAAWQLPAIVLNALGVQDVLRQVLGPLGLASGWLVWTVFGIWFLRTRRIGRTGWNWRGGEVDSAGLDAIPAPASREAAMQCWLLGSATPLGIGLQWGSAASVLVLVQLLVPKLVGGESTAGAVTAMLFTTLSLNAVAIGAVAAGIARRSRGLWLAAGRSRLELHAWCERLMLRVVAAILLPFALLATLLWWWLPQRPALPPLYLAAALLMPALAAGWFGLMQVHRRIALDAVAGVLLVVLWYYSLVEPLSAASAQPRWLLVAMEAALVVLLRAVAHARWRAADWPRHHVAATT